MHAADIKAGRTYISIEHGSEYRVDAIEDGPLKIVRYTIVSGPSKPECRADLEDFAKRVQGIKAPITAGVAGSQEK